MMADHHFASVVRDNVEKEQFSDTSLQWYFEQLCKPQSPITLLEEVQRGVHSGRIREEEKLHYIDLYKDIAKNTPTPAEQEHMRTTVGAFVRTQKVKKAIHDSFDLINAEKWTEVEAIMSEAVRSGVTALDLGQDYFGDVDNRLERRKNEEATIKVATGIPGIDDLLHGGISQKQLGLIVGGTGRGKSIFLEWLAKTAVFSGRNVVYFTLELAEDHVAERFDSMLCRVKPNMLTEYHDQVAKELGGYTKTLGNRLWIKEYPAMSASVGTLKSYLMQLANKGIQPDLILVDYLDLMKPSRYFGDVTQEVDHITKELHGLAKEMNTRIWTASQLNRSGLAMDNPNETSIAGALAKLFTVDIALFLAQTPEEREDEEIRILVQKNRNGPAGRGVKIYTDYGYFTLLSATQPDTSDAQVRVTTATNPDEED